MLTALLDFCTNQDIFIHSVQFSRSVVSDSLQPYEQQHTRPPCSSPTTGVYLNSCPLSWWCHPTTSSSVILLLLPSIFPRITAFSNESVLHIRWPKYWSFSFNISPSNEHPGLISFRMDWLDFLAVQGTFKSLLQHHSSKASILRCCFLYSPTLTSIHDYWKNHSLDQTDLCWPLLLPTIIPNIRVFSRIRFFPTGGQSIGVSASGLVLLMNIQDWFPLGLNGLISLQSKWLSGVFSNTTVEKHQFFSAVFFIVQLSHPHMTTGKTRPLARQIFVDKVMSLLFIYAV